MTPTFVFSVSILTMAVLAFGTTQTVFTFSSSRPSPKCTVDGCARPSSGHTADARTSGKSMAAGAARGSAQPSPSPGRASTGSSPRQPQPRSKIQISYRSTPSAAGGFVAELSIADHGGSPEGRWWLSVRLPGVRIAWMANATWHAGSNGSVIIKPLGQAGQLREGTTLAVIFAGAGQARVPSACLFDGVRCNVSK
jgi:Cellulose binding domain